MGRLENFLVLSIGLTLLIEDSLQLPFSSSLLPLSSPIAAFLAMPPQWSSYGRWNRVGDIGDYSSSNNVDSEDIQGILSQKVSER